MRHRCDSEHPRARGENIFGTVTICNYTGTSPRTRGKLAVTGKPGSVIRNIPAHAGKTIIRAGQTASV